MSLTSKFIKVAFLTACVVGGGAFTSALAGPEAIQASSKDKEIQEIVPVCDPRWYISVGGGADFSVGGELSHGFRTNFPVQTIIIGSVPGRADVKSANWDDVYDDAWHIQGELGYRLTHHLEVFGTFRYAHAEGVNRAGGNHVFVDFTGVGGPVFDFPFSRDFSDYTSVGGELGFRYFFLSKEARLRPYISLAGGVARTDSIDISTKADLSSVGGSTGFPVYEGAFFKDSWVGTGSAMLGLEARIACHWAIGVEGGVRYESNLSGNDKDYRGFVDFSRVIGVPLAPFRPSNDDTGDRLTIPVNGYLKFRF